jgi:CoA-transferase family III
MTSATVTAACLPDLQGERDRLAVTLAAAGLSAAASAIRAPGVCATGGDSAAECAVIAWAHSGLMNLTGCPGGPPLAPSAPVFTRVGMLADAIASLTSLRRQAVRLDVPVLLTSRASLRGWGRRGRASANGRCRLLRAADSWVAVNLSRPCDVASVPAVIGREPRAEAWDELAADAAVRPAAELAAAAQLVGIPAAVLGADQSQPAVRFSRLGEPGSAPPFVLDLSAMWAGPLCASILRQAGWRVLKVEDSRRPDGARSGPAAFYASLHAGIPAARLDFGSAAGRAELRRLAARAGVVLESSRPRALRQLGLVAEDWLAERPGRIWISVTGYGRDDPCQRAAFGDDAAAAGGLVAWADDGSPAFCGDAIADPLTGIVAGLCGLAASAGDGGWLVDVAMAGVCASLARQPDARQVSHPVTKDGDRWLVRHGARTAAVRAC